MKITFSFSSRPNDIPVTSPQLNQSLLLSPGKPHPFLKLGDYFHAVEHFLLENCLDTFLGLLDITTPHDTWKDMIQELVIRSEKQGALYHVSSVEAHLDQVRHKFSVISAVTETGRKALEKECRTLNHLRRKCTLAELPVVYFKGTLRIGHGAEGEALSFFLGEWFEGYHEWHVTRGRGDHPDLCIWDLCDGPRPATREEFSEIFRQASRTLTLLYDPGTSCQVHPWHHAAGDFVVGKREGKAHVRLTTARGYEPLITLPGKHPENNLANLLYFFLDMGLRMRLDRLDGVGEVVWIDGAVLPAVMGGFFEALRDLPDEGTFKETVARDFRDLINSFSLAELTKVFEPLLEIYRRRERDELKVIAEHLTGHVKELCSLRDKFPSSSPVSGS